MGIGEIIVFVVLAGFVLTFATMMTTRRMDRDEATLSPEEKQSRSEEYARQRNRWRTKEKNDLRSPEQ